LRIEQVILEFLLDLFREPLGILLPNKLALYWDLGSQEVPSLQESIFQPWVCRLPKQ